MAVTRDNRAESWRPSHVLPKNHTAEEKAARTVAIRVQRLERKRQDRRRLMHQLRELEDEIRA
eukprot:48482-Eustigmatos_ZCMA.PRE.1